jgi:uncharacterized repeat protein (TIGR03803 family)
MIRGTLGIVLVFCAMTTIVVPVEAQTLTTLYRFCDQGRAGSCPDGAAPEAALVQATNGEFYGTTLSGGTANYNGRPVNAGTVFKITPSGHLTTVHSFCDDMNTAGECADGNYPYSGLMQATNGILYGTTGEGGAQNSGTVYSLTLSGAETVLYNFCKVKGAHDMCLDGNDPLGGLVQATNGFLYGTTFFGGTSTTAYQYGAGGTVFRITPANALHGSIETLHSFCNEVNCADGGGPEYSLIQAPSGELYGTTLYGGTGFDLNGTVFKVTPGGIEALLYSFIDPPILLECPVGSEPNGLVQATDGNLYVSTVYCGDNDGGVVVQVAPSGLALQIYEFGFGDNCSVNCYANGASPNTLIQATDGNFYGTTSESGNVGTGVNNGQGTIFKLTSEGVLTTLYTFCSKARCADGADPAGALVQGTDGDFYGTTYQGGSAVGFRGGSGTVFRFSVGLPPFVKTLTKSGSVGASVKILGNALKGTKSVTFNGIEAAFTAASDSEITATVPAGATTGTVKVTTATAVLSSNAPFMVTEAN